MDVLLLVLPPRSKAPPAGTVETNVDIVNNWKCWESELVSNKCEDGRSAALQQDEGCTQTRTGVVT